MFKTTLRKIQHFLLDDDGPTAVEYAVMLMLILLVCITAIQLVGAWGAESWGDTANKLDEAMGS